MLGNLKGITSTYVASQCVLKLYQDGQVETINKSEPQQLAQYAAHFIANTDETQPCNFATFVPIGEDAPLQVTTLPYTDSVKNFYIISVI